MSARIFISYRRDDDPGTTGRLFDRLENEFGRDQLFMDVEGDIRGGHDFSYVIEKKIGECDVLLAIIGARWIDVTDQLGQRRIDNPDDFVRIEIVAALQRKKRVIPVLVNNAPMPIAASVPIDLKPLLIRNAIRLSHERFPADLSGLVRDVRSALSDADSEREAILRAEREAVEAAASARAEADRKEREDKETLERSERMATEELARRQELERKAKAPASVGEVTAMLAFYGTILSVLGYGSYGLIVSDYGLLIGVGWFAAAICAISGCFGIAGFISWLRAKRAYIGNSAKAVAE